jgi:acrosin
MILFLSLVSLQAEPFGKSKVSKAEGSVIRRRDGVETGPDAKAEIDMLDGSLVRVGANARFSYTPGTREAKLDNGTMLFSSPKGAGGVTLTAGGTVTSTTGAVDFEAANFGGNVKVISLNGKPVVSLSSNPSSKKSLRPGAIISVPPGAAALGKTDIVNLKTLIDTGGLMKMGALPSQKAIERNANGQSRNPTFKLGLNMDAYGIGPTITAAMLAQMRNLQAANTPAVPVLRPNQVPTPLQVAEFAAAGVPVPSSNVRALERSGSTITQGGHVKPLPPPQVIQPAPLPTPQPTPRPPIRPPTIGGGPVRPPVRPPILRPPIAPP